MLSFFALSKATNDPLNRVLNIGGIWQSLFVLDTINSLRFVADRPCSPMLLFKTVFV